MFELGVMCFLYETTYIDTLEAFCSTVEVVEMCWRENSVIVYYR